MKNHPIALSRRDLLQQIPATVAGLLALMTTIQGCAPPASAPAATAAAAPTTAAANRSAQAGTLNVAVRNPVCGLDPAAICGYPSGPAVLALVYNRLVRIDTDMQVYPDLAESWEVSPDGLKWTFHLRKGVTFHDGTPFNSQAVTANFQRLRDPALALGATARFDQAKTIETPDDYTVVFGTETPFGPFLNYIGHYSKCMISPAAIKQYGAKDIDKNPTGTGMYRVAEFTPNVRLTLARSANYFGGPAALDQIAIIPSPDASARLNLLRTGQVDVAEDIPIEELKSAQSDSNLTVIQKKSLYAQGIEFNFDRPPFDDVRVRQAFNYAIDKDTIVKTIFGGAASVLDSPLASPMLGHKSIMVYDYNPEKAKALLADAGWKDTKNSGVVEKDGVPLRPTYAIGAGYLKEIEVGQAIQGYLKAAGVDLQIKQVDNATFGKIEASDRGQNTYDLLQIGFNPSDGSSIRQLRFDFLSNPDPKGKPYEGNYGWYSNADVDKNLQAASLEVDQVKQAATLATAQELIMQDAVWIWLYAPDLLEGVRKNVTGVDVFPMTFLALWRASKS